MTEYTGKGLKVNISLGFHSVVYDPPEDPGCNHRSFYNMISPTGGEDDPPILLTDGG
jgi:hypothetical protein